MSSAGKGSSRRRRNPKYCSREQYDRNYERALGKKHKKGKK